MHEMTNANEQPDRTKKWAWALIASAFLIPILASMVAGDRLSFQVGHTVGYYGGALAVAMLIASLATARRAPLVKARGDLCVGILLIGLSIATTYAEWREREGMKSAMGDLASVIKEGGASPVQALPAAVPLPPSAATAMPSGSIDEAYLRGLTAMVKAQAAEISAIRRQLQEIDLTPILAPQTLANLEQIGAARERLNGFKRLLLAERDAVEKNQLEAEKYLRTTPATTPFRSEVLSGFDQSKVRVVEAYSAYHKAELRIVRAAETLLGFAASRREAIQLDGDRLLFSTQTDLDAYNAMLTELQSAAAQEKIATKKLEGINDQLQSDQETLTKFSR